MHRQVHFSVTVEQTSFQQVYKSSMSVITLIGKFEMFMAVIQDDLR